MLVISGSDPLDGASIRRHASFDVPGFPVQDRWKANESVALQNQSAHLRGSKVRSRPAWLRGYFESCPFAMVSIYIYMYTFVCLPRSRSRLAEHLLVILGPTFPSTLLLKSCRPEALSLFFCTRHSIFETAKRGVDSFCTARVQTDKWNSSGFFHLRLDCRYLQSQAIEHCAWSRYLPSVLYRTCLCKMNLTRTAYL